MTKQTKTKTVTAGLRTKGELFVPRISREVCRLTIDGISPLMVHRFAEKSKRQMEEKTQKVAKTAKEARDPVAEFQAALYPMPGKPGRYGMPASGLKNCAVAACRFIDGIPMTVARGAFHVIDEGGGLIPIDSPEKPEMDERPVRIGGFKKTAMIRYRPRWDKWSATFRVAFNPSVISPEQLLNLFDNAGFSVGLCEWRPQCNGSYGMFEVRREKIAA